MKRSTKSIRTTLALLATVAVVAVTAAGCATAGAEPVATEQAEPAEPAVTTRAVIGVRTPRHVEVALLTARQMLDGTAGYRADDVAIVVCGKGVGKLVKGAGLDAQVDQAVGERGVRVVACGLTIERMGIDPSTLLDSVEIVPNSIIEMARLQALGYQSVEL